MWNSGELAQKHRDLSYFSPPLAPLSPSSSPQPASMKNAVPLSFLALGPAAAFAADLSVPSTWRNPTGVTNRAQRITAAQEAIDYINQWVSYDNYELSGLGYWPSANVWSAIALKDKFTGTQVNRGIVSDALGNNIYWHPAYYKWEYNDDAMWWGTANMYAWQAYQDSVLLGYAVTNWNEVSKYVIKPEHITAKKHPYKSFALAQNCDGASMAGGVFWTNKAADTAMNAITTGLYMTLSAYLAEATGDSKYTNAAIAAANWIKAHTYNTSTKLVMDSVSASDCSKSPDTWVFTYNSGKFVEGLSVLTDVTKNESWRTLMIETAAAAVKASKWQGSDGIIFEGSDGDVTKNNDGRGFKAIFIRGLTVAFLRNSANADFSLLLRRYINVQYNALRELSRNGASYGVPWKGPWSGPYSHAQLAALDPVVDAIAAAWE